MTLTYHSGRRIQGLSTHPVLDTATYTDDFSSDNWTDNGTPLNKVNTSTGVLDWNAARSGSNEKTVYDLGAGNVSNTAWVLRFKWTIVNHTGGSGSDPDIFFGLCDTPQTTSITDSSNTAFGIRAHGGATNNMYAMSQDNADLWHASSKDYEFTETPTIGTYYVEIRKTGSLTGIVTLFSDSNYSITIESSGEIALENTDGLRYIFFANYPLSASTPPFNGTVDDLKFYNGISSLTTKPTNVQVGSRFEETNTRKMYNLRDPGTNVLYTDATGHSNTSSHGTVAFIGDNATYATLFSRITATNTTHPHPSANIDAPNKAFSSSDPWTIELTFKESYTIPSGSTITYNSYNNGQGARLKYLDFQVYTGSTWENITGTITNPNHSDGDVETVSGRWVKYMTSTTTTEKTGTKFRIRMWDSWDNYVGNGRHYIGGIELKIPIGNVEWQEIGS